MVTLRQFRYMRTAKKWILATFILTFLVIIAGGIVRTTHSGMGCPDWPRCFGKWIPPTNASELPIDFEKFLQKQDIDHTFNAFHTWIEYINRLLGVLLGLFAVIQLGILFFHRKENKRSFRLAIAFFIAVVLTGLFGAIVVKLNLAHLSISVHLLLAIVLAQIQLALLLSSTNKIDRYSVSPTMSKLFYLLLFVIFTHSVLGTMVRIYVDDVSAALHYGDRPAWLAEMPLAFIIHRTFSWVVLLAGFYVAYAVRAATFINKQVFALLALLIVNMIVGIVLFYLDMPAFAQPLHLFLAACAITQAMSVILQSRNTFNA